MIVKLSPHATALVEDILDSIANALSWDDALRWYEKIQKAVLVLEDFPQSGTGVPDKCFQTVPDGVERLRQTFCLPYRIVYEIVDDEVHVLSIRHSRMLVADSDTAWH